MKKEETTDDFFCTSLAADIKELHENLRYMAKQEIRNVLFKYQMAAMDKKTVPIPNNNAHVPTSVYNLQFVSRIHSTVYTPMLSPPMTPISYRDMIDNTDIQL